SSVMLDTWSTLLIQDFEFTANRNWEAARSPSSLNCFRRPNASAFTSSAIVRMSALMSLARSSISRVAAVSLPRGLQYAFSHWPGNRSHFQAPQALSDILSDRYSDQAARAEEKAS